MSATTGVVIQALLLALAVMLVVALVLGLAVAVHPTLLDRFERASNRRVSLRELTRPLDVPHNIDRYFYRHHRLYGAAVVVLAVALLSFLAFGRPDIAWQSLFEPGNRAIGAIVTDAARVVLWILGLFALAVGAVVFLRPSALKAVEGWANRWLSTREALRDMEREFHGPEDWMRRHPRAWGIVIAVASALCLLALFLQVPAILRLAG